VALQVSIGIGHAVFVTAESLYEGAALAIKMFAVGGSPAGPGATLEIAAQWPVVSHAVTVRRVKNWLESGGKSPREQALKSRPQEMIG
jgi:hypothetical protein